MLYPKIHSLWMREDIDLPKKIHALIPGQYACPEFGNIKRWHVTEKIDGTNIRIGFNTLHLTDGMVSDKVQFKGRSDEALLPPKLLAYLRSHFTPERLLNIVENEHDCTNIWLFGEGYGSGIQAVGGNYQKEQRFILFDVVVGNWWLTRESVIDIASKLNIPYAPTVGIMTEDEIVAHVKSRPKSLCSTNEQIVEGVVCRPEQPLLFRDGKPVMFKLKCKDF